MFDYIFLILRVLVSIVLTFALVGIIGAVAIVLYYISTLVA